MRKTILIGGAPVGACQMRGLQTSQALEKYCSLNVPYLSYEQLPTDIRDTIIIFVGEPLHYCGGVDELIRLRNSNNILVYDIIDNFCFKHTNPLINKDLLSAYSHLHVMLHTNKLSKYQLSQVLVDTEHIVVPHQWDIRNEGISTYAENRVDKAVYIGGISGGFQLDVSKLVQYVDVYEAPHTVREYQLQYSTQVSFRKENSLDYLYKPCTKLAIATSFASILLTSREPSVTDILGDAYEFYIDSEADLIKQVEKIRSMSDDEINYYRYATKHIKEYLSPEQNAYRYSNLIQKYT